MDTTSKDRKSTFWKKFLVEKISFKPEGSASHFSHLMSCPKPFQNDGRSHNMIFRHSDHRVDRMQSNLKIETEDVKFNFGCHTLTQGTTLRIYEFVSSLFVHGEQVSTDSLVKVD